MRHTKFAALIDPDPTKKLNEYSLKLVIENADRILVGGTPSEDLVEDEEHYTRRCIERIRKMQTANKAPIYIFPGSPSQVVPGADYLLYLFLPNSNNSFFGWGVQVQSINDVLKTYPMERLKPMMYLPRGGQVAEFSNVDRGWKRNDYEKAARIANMLGFESLYLEGGSGGESFDIDTVKSVSRILDSNKELYLGGGFVSENQVEEIKDVVDAVVVGTALEREAEFAGRVRKILHPVQRSS